MERSKNQAVYQYLPGMWVSDNSDSGRPITAVIDNWNWRDMEGIYERFIVGEIKRQIRMFDERGGISLLLILHTGSVPFVSLKLQKEKGLPTSLGQPHRSCSTAAHVVMCSRLEAHRKLTNPHGSAGLVISIL